MEVVAVPSIGWPELLIILAVLLLLFGAKRLPEMARSIGKSSREFKKGMREGATEEDEEGPSEERAEAEKKDESPASE